MAAVGILEALLSLKEACLEPSHPQCRVRTYVGEFEVQKCADGTAAGYQAYLDYVQHAGLTEIMVSRCARCNDGHQIVVEKNDAPGVAGAIERFHRLVADVICRLVGRVSR